MTVDEPRPTRTCKSKRFTKVMFMAAVARPRYDPAKKAYFDGKIGIWPFVQRDLAKNHSKNRPKGTMVTKPVENINHAQFQKMLVENVLPAVRQKMPRGCRRHPIFVQQDNARPHGSAPDSALQAELGRDGWQVRIRFQPPNSPDLNVLDLGYFNSIQSLQHQAAPTNIDEPIGAVEKSFDERQQQL